MAQRGGNSQVSGQNPADVQKERYDYIQAFNNTMLQIWKEQQVKLKTVDKGNLFNSVRMTHQKINGKVTEIDIQYGFCEYGVYVDRGTGREVPRGNPGDIGHDKVREAKPWMSRKFYSSFCNIRDFFAESLGEEFCAMVAEVLAP